MNQVETLDYADRIAASLLADDIHILRYDSPAYYSVYMKFDYGLGNSLRIANHESKKEHLMYRFNLLTYVKQPYVDNNGKYPRYYFGPAQIDKLIAHIRSHIYERKIKYGEERYKKYMNERYLIAYGKFWERATELKKEQYIK